MTVFFVNIFIPVPLERLEPRRVPQQNRPARRVRNRLVIAHQQIARADVNLQNDQRENNQGQPSANPVIDLDNPEIAVNVEVPPPIPRRLEGLGRGPNQKDKNIKMKRIASNTIPLNAESDRANEAPKPKQKK